MPSALAVKAQGAGQELNEASGWQRNRILRRRSLA
jgi:hypothetical protein